MKLALVTTVKNERDLLRSNIEYHCRLGIDHFFVFLDGTEDNTQETINDLPFVVIQNSVDPAQYALVPELKDLIENYQEHHTARQCLNAYHALQVARNEGFDWLVSLDPDELICPHLDRLYPGQLKDFFTSITPNIELVRFQPLEVVSRRMHYENVFKEEVLFKLLGKKIKHKIYDPINSNCLKVNGFYGHSLGKSAIRTAVEAKPDTVHKFQRMNGTKLIREWHGWLLHYNCYDFNDFLKKFTNFKYRPDTFLSGNRIEFTRYLWRELVNNSNLSFDELKEYFNKWIMFHPLEVHRLLKKKAFGFFPIKPALITVSSVQKFLSEQQET